MFQCVLTPAAGKRLIAKGVAAHPEIGSALKSSTVVIVAGTTNGYVAEELLSQTNQAEGFDKKRFFRGVTLPPAKSNPNAGPFPGDVVLVHGIWQKGQTIFDVLENLKEGDVILKGANALDLARREAGVLVGDPKAGTIAASVQAAVGRRVRLILPVGVEKRIQGDLHSVIRTLNAPGAKGPRMYPAPGEIITELDAIKILTGATAVVSAAGGVGGAEGAVWLIVTGESGQEKAAGDLLESILREEPFTL